MLFTSATLALVAILPALASPIQKRFNNVKIRAGRDGTCLSLPPLASQPLANGNPVYKRNCAEATSWNIERGSGSITVANTAESYALDAGVNPHNNVAMKIWQSYPGATQQTWYYTDDNRIAITGGDQCLDLGDNGPQTYQCTPGNTNQVWYVDSGNPSPSTTVSSSTTPSASSTSAPPPTQTPRQIQYVYGDNGCLTASGTPADGTPVVLGSCATSSSNTFYISPDNVAQLFGTNYCLDAGSNPSNGVALKLWTCGGYPQQKFRRIQRSLVQTSNDQCLDVKADEPSVVQTWQCSVQDDQQQFIFTPY